MKCLCRNMGGLMDEKGFYPLVNYGLKQLFPVSYKTASEKNQLSTLGIKYPTLRDHPLRSAHSWLEGKRVDDGAEGLWRIHNSLYDFSDFISVHPGGKDWLKLTRGTDITEAFETHHLTITPEKMLSRFYITNAKQRRNSPFTFKDGGFYKTLKRDIYKMLLTLPNKSTQRSKYITDLLFSAYVILTMLAVYLKNFTVGALAGMVLGMVAIASHNFFHQKDNFRMNYFDFTMMLAKDWRISHAISHHLYTNTVNDLEISMIEPFLQFLPTEKNVIFRYASWIYSPIIYAFMYPTSFFKTFIQQVFFKEEFTWSIFLPFTVPILTQVITKESVAFCAVMFGWIIIISGIHFGTVGLNAGHHHPDVFHDGDKARPKNEMDWGIYQLDAVMDREEITGSHFLVLTNFGDHTLHHLFPTLDHALLQYLYPIFLDTCKQFGTEWRLSTQIEAIQGQYRQLAKVYPKTTSPTSLQVYK